MVGVDTGLEETEISSSREIRKKWYLRKALSTRSSQASEMQDRWLSFISKGHEMVLLPPCTLKRLLTSLALEAIKKLQFGLLFAKETMTADLTTFLSDLSYRFFLLTSQFDDHE